MTSKRKAGPKGKVKSSKTSSSKEQVTTIAALFQKQLLQHKTLDKNDNGGNKRYQESDDDVKIVQEEQLSQYFSPKKSRTRSVQLDVSDPEDSKACGAEDHLAAVGTQRRLSSRLSLRKTSQRGSSSNEPMNSDDTVASAARRQVDVGAAISRGRPKSSSFVEETQAEDSDKATEVSEGSSPCPVRAGSNSDEINTVTKTGKGNALNKGKLSQKRKKHSEDDATAGPSSPKKSKPFFKTADKQCDVVKSVTSVVNIADSVSPGTVFSIFKQSSSELRSSVVETSSTTSASAAVTKAASTTSASAAVTKAASTTSASAAVTKAASTTSASAAVTKAASTSRRTEPSDTRRPEAANQSEKTEETVTLEESVTMKGDGAEEDKDKMEKLYRVPYYLENFNTVVKSVLEDEYNRILFDDVDLQHVTAYNNLSESSQKVYVRLFSRKLAWLSTSKIKYPEIAEDLAPCLQELVTSGLLSSGEDLGDLPAVLGAMSAPDLRSLAKLYHLNPLGSQKGQIITALITKSQQNTVASLFGQKKGAVQAAMLKRSKKLLGPMYQLLREPRAVFVRAMMLSSLINTNGDEESGNGGQRQLFQMLLVNMGRVVYPSYTVNRQTQIFSCRRDLIRFEEALQLEAELLGYIGAGNWKGAYSSFLTVKDQYDKVANDSGITDWDSQLPEFLRCYTAGSVLVRLLNQGIEILQRRKDYTAAVALIRELLGQQIYHMELHGYWWDRLALNLDVHLKQQEQALQAIQDGLADQLVRSGHRLSLLLRAEAICTKPKSLFSKRLRDFPHEPLQDLPKTYVDGRVLPHELPGCRYQFITNTSYADGSAEEVTMCNVEQIVLDHYQAHGYPQGIHAEGSVVSTLFCLYFWDVLFMDVADAFHSPYQTTPLDLHTDAFYDRRQKCIDDQLATIEESSEEALEEMLAVTWEKHNGVLCAGISWERFSSVKEVQGLVRCMGGRVLGGILRRYAQQPRHMRSGFPDLTLWNTSSKQLKISEVKGPGDRLSHKQMLWLDYLLKQGVDAEVCHVKPVGVKKLKPLTKSCNADEQH